MEARLTAAFNTSQNGKQLCLQYQKEAKKVLMECRDYGRKLQRSEGILHSLEVTFIDQLQLLGGLFGTLNERYIVLERNINALESRKGKILSRIAKIFWLLKEQCVDSELDPGIEESSLFEFVDTDAVGSLQNELTEFLLQLQVGCGKYWDDVDVNFRLNLATT